MDIEDDKEKAFGLKFQDKWSVTISINMICTCIQFLTRRKNVSTR